MTTHLTMLSLAAALASGAQAQPGHQATCAVGFCEDPANCPQCAAGFECIATAGMVCAGTCFGTCAALPTLADDAFFHVGGAAAAPPAPAPVMGADPATWSPVVDAPAPAPVMGADPATWSPPAPAPVMGADPATWSPVMDAPAPTPVMGADPATWSPGTCAVGFCEDPANCPQCAAGFECIATAGMVCAGTCFGTCAALPTLADDAFFHVGDAAAAPPAPVPAAAAMISEGCLQYFDGCNTCSRDDASAPLACTMMMCFMQGTPVCSTYAAGFGPTTAVASMPGSDSSTWSPTTLVAQGGSCASGFCEDAANCPQCAAGLTCQVEAGIMCAGTCFGTCTGTGGH
jgi:hypothetical protein